MMINASKFAIAIAALATLAISTVEESSSAPAAVAASTHAAPAATEASQYWTCFYDGYGPYAYRPAYSHRGYTYRYPDGSWVYPRDNYYYIGGERAVRAAIQLPL